MRNIIAVAIVALVTIQNANSLPQFGQSFSSPSITDSSGKVLSKSVYTDTTGKKIINGLPQLEVDLLPPFLSNQIPGLDLPVSNPFNKPSLSLEVEPPLLPAELTPVSNTKIAERTTARPTTTTTARPTTTTTVRKTIPQFSRVEQRPVVNNFIQQSGKSTGSHKANENDGKYTIKGHNDGQYRNKGSDDGSYKIKGDDGIYRPKGNLGYYVHNNAGKYVHDNRVRKI